MKKLLFILLAAAMLTVALVGCTPTPDNIPNSSEDPTENETAKDPDSEINNEGDTTPMKKDYNLQQYAVIYPEGTTDTTSSNVTAFYEQLCQYVTPVGIGNDTIAADEEETIASTTEILCGITNRQETADAMAKLSEAMDYVIAFYENKIVLYGKTDQGLVLAMDRFMAEYVKTASEGVILNIEVGTLIMGEEFTPVSGLTAQSFCNYPRFRSNHNDAHLCSNNGDQYFYTDVTANEIEAYAKKMQNVGFNIVQDHTANRNRSITFLGMGGSIHLFYQEAEKSLVVSADNGSPELLKKPLEGSWITRVSNSFAVMTMDYSKYSCSSGCNPRYDNNGLCYIITLEDGRFIVYDGGYSYANDAQIIYEFLRDNNSREGLPVIAAWVFTHSHGDHYGAFETFTTEHAKDVVVEAFVMNTGTNGCYSKGHNDFLEKIPTTLGRTHYPTAQTIQLHIGQSLYFGNVEIEALYTHEMFHFDSRTLSDENTASLVTRVWIDGVSILLSGDTYAGTAIAQLYGDYLKSDFFQVPHHGNGGGTKEFYQAVDPDYILWTTSQPGFRRRTSGIAYSVGMPSSTIAQLNKQMFEDVGGTRESINANGAINNWCADGPVDILTFGENKEIHVTYYKIRQALLPNNPIEKWNAGFVADNR